jgi:hypothetical protein
MMPVEQGFSFRRTRPRLNQVQTVDTSAEPRELDSSEVTATPTNIPFGARGRDPGGYPRIIPAGQPFGEAGEPHRQELPKSMELPARPFNSAQYLSVSGVADADGQLLNDGLAFPIRTIMIDNFTTIWLYVSGAERFIPPLTMGWQFVVARASTQLRVTAVAPGGITQPSLTAGGVFSVFAFEDMMVGTASGSAA